MDVIGREPERDGPAVRLTGRSATRHSLPWAAVLALVFAALIGFLFGRTDSARGLFGSSTVGDLTGSIVLELQEGAYVERSALSDQAEYRNENWKGTITVDAGSDHTGAAHLKGSASYVPTDTGPVIAHVWGAAAVTLDGQACTGKYAFSSYRDSTEGGGSVHLRCDEGAALGATIEVDGVEPPSDDGTRNWTITLALSEGYLFER